MLKGFRWSFRGLALGLTAAGTAVVGAAIAQSDVIRLASLSPAEINRETAKAIPVDLTLYERQAPPGADDVRISYTIHLGGFRLVQLDLHSIIHDNEYLALSFVETKGLVEVFASARIRLVATGDVIDGRVAPRTYNSDQEEKKKRQLVGLLFGQDGPLEVAADPPYDLERFPVSEELKFQTVDPLSAALYVSLLSGASSGDPCTRTVPIFDGKRRYNLEMTYAGEEEELSLGRGNYRGPAVKCRLQYKRIAGFKPPKPGRSPTPVPPSTFGWPRSMTAPFMCRCACKRTQILVRPSSALQISSSARCPTNPRLLATLQVAQYPRPAFYPAGGIPFPVRKVPQIDPILSTASTALDVVKTANMCLI